jgi:alkanesulfonate monooxygenase SsuD/methylene tetrahydromethanopterin reductase-like flavin-dependent oxidoreductase (luciferase family)
VITKFSVLYVGHIELENIGRDGTPADERRYPNERLVEAYATARELAQLMDELGFHCLWTAEHHFQREGYEVFPNLILLNTWLATQTARLKLGCAFNVLPAWHPLRLAEDFAFADIVTGGRIVFGVGRGYQTREVETLGGPLLDQEANRERFEEGLEIIRKAFDHDSFSHHGKHYRIPAPVEFRDYRLEEVTLVPRPVHRPVEIWQAISSGRSIARMAQQGIKGMVTLTGVRMLDEWLRLYRDEAAKAGRELELGEDICWGVGLCLADTEEEAVRRMEPYHEERYKWYAPFGLVRYIDEQGRQWGTPGAPSGVPPLRDAVAQGANLCGPASTVIERIREIERRYPGLDQMMIHFPEGMSSAEFMEQLRLFARDVMPAFAAQEVQGLPAHVRR